MKIPHKIRELFDSKYVKEFEETTPQNNVIKGKILLNHGFYHGSLLIETVNGKQAMQFVRGFPKIHYYDRNRDEELDGLLVMRGFEKLDGTCVGLYWLYDDHDQRLELVPKSRQRPILDEHFREMLHYCDTNMLYDSNIQFRVIYFELFGMLNEHTLPHKKTYIDIRTIGAVETDGITLMNPLKLSVLADKIFIPLPHQMIIITSEKPERYYMDIDDPLFERSFSSFKSFEEVIISIEDYLDRCNEQYKKEKGYLKYEGVVLQIHDKSTNMKYIKIKSKLFKEEFGTSELSVPINEIRKEIQKIINENLSTYEENYNEKETINLIKEYLSEEYNESDINNTRTKNVIIKELHKYIDSIQDKSTNKIVDDILNNNSSRDITELMKYFGNNYPLLKHKSSDVYFLLSKRLENIIINMYPTYP